MEPSAYVPTTFQFSAPRGRTIVPEYQSFLSQSRSRLGQDNTMQAAAAMRRILLTCHVCTAQGAETLRGERKRERPQLFCTGRTSPCMQQAAARCEPTASSAETRACGPQRRSPQPRQPVNRILICVRHRFRFAIVPSSGQRRRMQPRSVQESGQKSYMSC
jgi:hypothetical protein